MTDLIFGLIGGTALLMYGVDKMGDGLEKASGTMMKKILKVLTGTVWSAFIVGTLLTALVQSSTAITVLTVGFVNAGLMELPQAIGIIYGANIGTTITAQLMSFSFSLNLTAIALPVLGIGFAINYFTKNETLKNLGQAVMGFGMMFLGLKILNSGVPYLQNSTTLKYFFTHYASIPVVGILLGCFAAALVHSSSATVGLTIILAQAGLIDLQTAICIMLGDNIGTCITAQLASLTGNINARRTAWAHTIYNIIGVLAVAIILPPFVTCVQWLTSTFQHTTSITTQIANSHTIFNVLSAVIFLPITKYYVRFLEFLIKPRKKGRENESTNLDRLLLDTPVAAFKAALSEMSRGTDTVLKMFDTTMNSLYSGTSNGLDEVKKDENYVNTLQKDLTLYVVDVSKHSLTDGQSSFVPVIINGVNNIERVGDHIIDLVELASALSDKNLAFSNDAIDELKKLQNIVINMFELAQKSINENNIDFASKAGELEGKVDEYVKHLTDNHIKRLEEGICNVESGVVYLDVINYLERIADHVYNISKIMAGKPSEVLN